MEIIKSEEEFDSTIVKYEIIEIGETNFQPEFINENNISNSFSNNIKQDEYTTTKFAEVYLDSIHDCLKYICLRCKTSELSIDNIINHFKEFKNTCKNINIKSQPNFNDDKILGVFFVGYDSSISYSCSCCNLTLYNRSYIYPHLQQHLNKFKKSPIDQKKRIANVYLLNNSTYSFLYSCNTCNQTFQSLDEHLQINSETCGNPLLNIKNEIDKEDELNANQSKLCEIFMNTEKKISFMCLYCFEHHTDISSLSDHLIFHLHDKETQVGIKEKIIENTVEFTFTEALFTIESAAPEKSIVRNNNIKSENILDSEKDEKTLKIYKCEKCKNTMKSEETLYEHWRSFHSTSSKVNSNKKYEISPYVQQFLKQLSRSEKKEFVQSENSSGEEESNPLKLLDFCTSLPNLLPNIFNTPSSNNKSTIKIPDDSTNIRNEKQIENVQNTITNSTKSLPTKTIKENNKNINKVKSKKLSKTTENEQVDIGIKHRAEVPANQTPIKDGLNIEEYFEILDNNNMDNDNESISQDKSNTSILSSPKYKCNLCARELRYKWYLHDHLFRIHGIKKLTYLKKRRKRKI